MCMKCVKRVPVLGERADGSYTVHGWGRVKVIFFATFPCRIHVIMSEFCIVACAIIVSDSKMCVPFKNMHPSMQCY